MLVKEWLQLGFLKNYFLLQSFCIDILPFYELESCTAKKVGDKSWSPLALLNQERSQSEQLERSAA